jgi:hypothetical protein
MVGLGLVNDVDVLQTQMVMVLAVNTRPTYRHLRAG